jgi:hypothetical protein
MKIPLRITLSFVALALLAAACSSARGAETTTTTFVPVETTTTTQPTTTTNGPTTTTEPPVVIPATINGLPAESDDLIDRRVVAVKIDNHANARPQSGVELADAVYEVLVEGGITRLIALFHQSDTEYVGPNRSGRPTDAELVRPLGGPFQISGAQPWVQQIFRDKDLFMVYDNRTTTYRMSHRWAPHNLYSSTIAIRDWADEQGWPDDPPPPLFVYGEEPTPLEGRATEIVLRYSAGFVGSWTWNGKTYLRATEGQPHMWVDAEDGEGQLAFDTVVVLKAERYSARGSSGSSVPALHTVGTGEAIVFRSGGVLEGTWERADDTEMIRIFDGDGDEIVLPPGRVWISVFPDDRELTWE